MIIRLGFRGFTVIEILIGIALLALLAAGGASIVSRMGMQQSDIVTKDEATEFVSALNLWISNPDGCDQALGGKALPVGGSTNLSISSYKGYGMAPALNGGSETIQATYKLTPRLTVNSMKLKDKGVPPFVVRVDGQSLRRVIAQIEIELAVKSAERTELQRKRYIEVPVLLAAGSDTIVRCAGQASLADVCSAVGGTLDPVTNTCKPQANCTLQGSFMTLSCDKPHYGCSNASGQPLENPLTNSSSCPAGSVASQTGVFNYSHTVECGKKCTDTVYNTLKFYICMRCN